MGVLAFARDITQLLVYVEGALLVPLHHHVGRVAIVIEIHFRLLEHLDALLQAVQCPIETRNLLILPSVFSHRIGLTAGRAILSIGRPSTVSR
uniref:Putative secreted protein n=1 Tax=Anopheles marajoara TaxID=58244 RepID=A0A2M4C9I1_9DIPT